MKTIIDTNIGLLDRIIKLAYRNMTLASWTHKQEWLREIDNALDERLSLMRMRDIQSVKNRINNL